MFELKKHSHYIKELLKLAFPMIMGNLGMVLIGAGDVFVAAKYSTNTLASISIANSIISIIFMFGIGLLISVSPLLSNFRGEKNNIKKYFIPTVNYSMILAFFSTIAALASIGLIDFFNFNPILVPDIKKYMFICAFSTFGGYLQAGLKEFLQAYEIVFFPNLLNILGVFLNVFLNFAFVFGLWGFPELGTVGLAVATLISRVVFGLAMLIYCLRICRVKFYSDNMYFIKLLKIGFPIAMAILLEFFAFNLITLIMGRVSGVFAAAQSILLTITTATFMIPLAISNAIAVKVGFANGAKDFVALKRYAKSGIFISVGFMVFCASLFLIIPEPLVKIFTNDPQLIKICVPIIILAGVFQVFDGMQVSIGGVFKGLKKTNIIMIGDFAAYWLLSLPLGILLGIVFKLELYGFWLGLTVALFVLALILSVMMKKEFLRIEKSAD